MQEKQLTEQESLQIITEMIGKTRNHFYESGSSTILWGSMTAICALTNFAQSFWNFSIGFDIWFLMAAAIIPQIWIAIDESKRKVVKSHEEFAIDAVWAVYIITIIAMLVYANVTYITTPRILAENGIEVFSKNIQTGEISPYKIFVPSFSSVMMIVYAFPTLATGLISKYRPFIVGAVVCYILFVFSLFTSYTYDMLFTAGSAIACWLIPGLMLRRKYLRQRK